MAGQQAFKEGDTVVPSGDVVRGSWGRCTGYTVERVPDGSLVVRDDRKTAYALDGDSPTFERMVIRGSCGDPFEDQRRFMHSMGQPTTKFDKGQVGLYLRLTAEEFRETLSAAAPSSAARLRELFDEVESLCRVEDGYDEVELLDGLQDVLVTTMGAGISAGFPMREGWEEVLKTNLAKVDPITGEVRRRTDGKVLKPEGWVGPTEKLRELLARRRGSEEG